MVVHYADGRTLAGYGSRFPPEETHVDLVESSTGAHVSVRLDEVKIICFVRSLSSSGVVRHRETPPVRLEPSPGRRAEIVFKDGERMGGYVNLQEKPATGFFVAPLNPDSNNARVYVNIAQVASFRFVT